MDEQLARYEAEKRQLEFYETQIRFARAECRDGFDRDKYLVKKKQKT